MNYDYADVINYKKTIYWVVLYFVKLNKRRIKINLNFIKN
jgi:hypothetical protein